MSTETPTRPATASRAKSGANPEKKPEKQFDPFRPDMPTIPGVPDKVRAGDKLSKSSANLKRLAGIGGIICAAMLVGVAVIWWMTGNPHRAAKTEISKPPLAVQAATSQEPVPSLSLSDGSVQVARLEDLAKPWSAKKFTFVKPFNHQSVAAMAIRLPGGALWGFALQEPYGPCELEYVTDLARLAKQYGYQASHPMVGNPCNKTIYDPTKLGSLGEGVWTRGEIVQGGGIRPPIAINIDVKDGFIIADRIE